MSIGFPQLVGDGKERAFVLFFSLLYNYVFIYCICFPFVAYKGAGYAGEKYESKIYLLFYSRTKKHKKQKPTNLQGGAKVKHRAFTCINIY